MIARRVYLAIGPAQSNEQGNGDEGQSSVVGAPLRDPVLPNGTAIRSMWPRLSELAGVRGTWLGVYNGGVGSTSITDSWCGCCRNWISGIIVVKGSYSISSGTVYKCTAVPSGNPTASTTTPAVGTGADSITWASARSVLGEDTDGHVYDSTSALFDPNGYLALAKTAMQAATSWDTRCALISIGQTDRTISSSRSQYSQGIQNSTAYLLANGADKVAVGFTCYAATSGAQAYYDSTLVPGWNDALTAMASNLKVFAGANLYQSLGVLPTSPASNYTPGLHSDQVHMNNAALALAAQAWATSLIAGGVI